MRLPNLAALAVRQEPSPLTCYTDAGTTRANVGDIVYRQNDLSGLGWHYNQATSGARPFLRQNAGGIYYLEYDDADGMASSTGLDLTSATGWTICFAASQTDAPANTRVLQSVVNNCLISLTRTSFGFYVGATVKSAVGISDSTLRVYTIGQPAGGNWWLRINGVDQTGLAAVTNQWGPGLAWGNAGAFPLEGFTGGAFAKLVYSAEYTGSARNRIESYVAAKSGVIL